MSIMSAATDTATEPPADSKACTVFLEIKVSGDAVASSFVALELPSPLRILQDEETNLKAMAPNSVDQRSGALLWEAAIDLGKFLSRMPSPSKTGSAPFVLELGAGHGVPGLCCAISWGATVHFHDMSEETLRSVTAVNCAMNQVRSQFLAGDWNTLTRKVREAELRYDVILASEAFYKEESYDDLLEFLSHQSNDCHAYFAGKRFYFGCGGGTASFSCAARSKGFCVTVEEVIEDGRSNIREILRITWPQDRQCKRPRTSS